VTVKKHSLKLNVTKCCCYFQREPLYKRRPIFISLYKHFLSYIFPSLVQLNLPNGAKINGANLGSTYKAQQLHLHWGKNGGPGSEHTIDGEKYPMEVLCFWDKFYSYTYL